MFTARVSVVALLFVLGYFALTAQQPPAANDAPAALMSESPAVESPLPAPQAQIAAVVIAEEEPAATPSTPQPGVAATEIAGAPPAANAGSEVQPAIAGIEATVEATAAPVTVAPIAAESSHGQPPATVQDPAPAQAAPREMSQPIEAELEATPPPA